MPNEVYFLDFIWCFPVTLNIPWNRTFLYWNTAWLAICVMHILEGSSVEIATLAASRKTCLSTYAKSVGPDQSAYPHSLITALHCSLTESLSIGYSGPAMQAYIINGYCSICRRTENVQNRLHGGARPSRSSLFAYGIGAIFHIAQTELAHSRARCCRLLHYTFQLFIERTAKDLIIHCCLHVPQTYCVLIVRLDWVTGFLVFL